MTAKKKAAKPKKPKPIDNRPIQAEAILDLIANHKTTLTAACRQIGVSPSLFLQWVRKDMYGLREPYEQARESYFTALAEECLEIADDGTNDYVERQREDGATFVALDREHVQRSALRISTRKWLIESGAKPRTGYGRDAEEDDADTINAAIAALERIATAKAATAR